jgi:hypothetical protein
MDLRLPNEFSSWGDSLKFPALPTRHRRPYSHSFVFDNRFKVFEAKIGECRPETRTGREKPRGPIAVPIRLVRIVLRFPIDEIRGNDLASQIGIASFDQAK